MFSRQKFPETAQEEKLCVRRAPGSWFLGRKQQLGVLAATRV